MEQYKIRVMGVMTLAGQYSKPEADKIMESIKPCIKDDIYLIPIKTEEAQQSEARA